MSIERHIRDVMRGEPLLEADQSRRLDMLVRQGLMSPAKLPILKRGLAKLNDGKAMAPNERDAVKSLLNSFMFIVLGDDTVFNRAKQNTQKNKYQQEAKDSDVCSCDCDCDDTICESCGKPKEMKEEFKPHDMWDPKTGEKKFAKTEKEHLALKDKGWGHEDPNQKEAQSEFARPAEKSPQATAEIKAKMRAKNKLRPKGVQEEEQLDEYGAPAKKKPVSQMTPAEKKANDDRRKAYNEFQKNKRNEAFDPDDEETLTDEDMEAILSGIEEADFVSEDDLTEGSEYKTGHKSYTDAVNHAFAHHAKRDNIHSSPDDKAQHIGLDSKKPGNGKTTRVNIPAKHKESGKKHMIHVQVYNKGGTHPYELNTYSSSTKSMQKEGVLDRDPESNSFNRTKSKTTTVQTGQKKNPKTGKMEPVYGKSTAPQGLPSMKKEDTGPSPLDIWKEQNLGEGAMKRLATDKAEKDRLHLSKLKKAVNSKPEPSAYQFKDGKAYPLYRKEENLGEGAFKSMATDAEEDARLKAQKKAAAASKKSATAEKETDPGIKKEEVVAEGGEVQSKTGGPMGKKNQMNKPVGYGIPGSKTPKPKPKKDTMIANPKSGKVRKVTASRGEMAVRKGFVYAEEWTTEEITSLLEMDYKDKFQAMLKKTGKKLSDMSDEDKKKFFNAVDGAHNAKNEDFEVGYLDSFNEYTAEQEELAIEEGAAEDARRDAARDSRGLAPTKKDKPDVSHNSKTDKSVEHIVPQLRKAMSIGKKVTFQDGKSHSVSKGHAAKFLNKYMTSKPADKEKMQSHGHTSIDHFKKHV